MWERPFVSVPKVKGLGGSERSRLRRVVPTSRRTRRHRIPRVWVDLNFRPTVMKETEAKTVVGACGYPRPTGGVGGGGRGPEGRTHSPGKDPLPEDRSSDLELLPSSLFTRKSLESE